MYIESEANLGVSPSIGRIEMVPIDDNCRSCGGEGVASGIMPLIDVSHSITDGMETYPGIPVPEIRTHLSFDDSRAHYAPGTEFQIGVMTLAANTGTADMSKRLDEVKWEMLEEWSKTKRAPEHARWMHDGSMVGHIPE